MEFDNKDVREEEESSGDNSLKLSKRQGSTAESFDNYQVDIITN